MDGREGSTSVAVEFGKYNNTKFWDGVQNTEARVRSKSVISNDMTEDVNPGRRACDR